MSNKKKFQTFQQLENNLDNLQSTLLRFLKGFEVDLNKFENDIEIFVNACEHKLSDKRVKARKGELTTWKTQWSVLHKQLIDPDFEIKSVPIKLPPAIIPSIPDIQIFERPAESLYLMDTIIDKLGEPILLRPSETRLFDPDKLASSPPSILIQDKQER